MDGEQMGANLMQNYDVYKIAAIISLGSLGSICKYFMDLGPDNEVKARDFLSAILVGLVCGIISYLISDIYNLNASWAGLIGIVSGLMGHQFIKKIVDKVGKKIDDISK